MHILLTKTKLNRTGVSGENVYEVLLTPYYHSPRVKTGNSFVFILPETFNAQTCYRNKYIYLIFCKLESF